MKLVVGLGNPGRKYEGTRHNVGFCLIDELARRWRVERSRRRFQGDIADGSLAGERVLLLKPATYMNLSGRSVRETLTFYRVSLVDVLVVVDDMALPLGKLRLRASGSAGGHNGLISVIQELGDDGFARLRIGIESVGGARAVGHVLGQFRPEERIEIDRAVIRAADAAECWLTDGIETAMNRFNRPED